MPDYFVRLAGVNIKVCMPCCGFRNTAKDYLTDSCIPDITVEVSQEDIFREKKSLGTGTKAEILAAQRKICDAVVTQGAFLMHGTVLDVEGQAYMFTAPSGTGKTTHCRLWLNNLPDAYIVNGDKPLIIAGDQQPQACGTPWAGKENWQTNTIVPLAAIVLMERSEDNEIHEISFSEAFPFLLRQTYQPKDTAKMIKTLQLLKSLDHKVRFYKFNFNNMKDDAFQVSYHELVEKHMDQGENT